MCVCMYIYASKYPYMHMFTNIMPNTRYNELHYCSPNKELGFRILVFQGGLPVVPPVPRTVQDPGYE